MEHGNVLFFFSDLTIELPMDVFCFRVINANFSGEVPAQVKQRRSFLGVQRRSGPSFPT